MNVWVEGATGKAGRRVTAALAAAGVAVRAASRHPGSSTKGVSPVRFDWYDESTWAAAIGDADALFLKGLDVNDNAAELMAKLMAGAPTVEHVVLMSAVGVDTAPETAPRRAVEEAVQNSGRSWTILRPSWLMQNFDEDEHVFARALRETDELYAGSGNHRVSFVDVRDVADAAVRVLTEEGHHRREYALTGHEALTFGEVAATLADASGRPVRHVDASVPEHRAHFARSGRPTAWVDHMLHLFALIRADVFSPVGDGAMRLTGRAPRTLAAYANEVLAGAAVRR